MAPVPIRAHPQLVAPALKFDHKIAASRVVSEPGDPPPALDPFNATLVLGSGTEGWTIAEDWTLTSVDGKLVLTGISTGPAAQAVPEPGTLVLLAMGLLSLIPVVRRRRM